MKQKVDIFLLLLIYFQVSLDPLLYIILLPIEFNFRSFFQLLISFNPSKLNTVFGSKEYLS